jgi:putative transport protein
MNWLRNLAVDQPAAYSVLLLASVSTIGLVAGGLRVRGVKLGATGVLFAGLVAGHFGWTLEHGTLDFIRDFGLILFVFTIGLQLGPGFFASLRRDGLRLNLLAGSVVVLGTLLMLGIARAAGFDWLAGIGLLAGATTNTPSLGAAQQTLDTVARHGDPRAAMPALAYAAAYPGGVVGIIVALLITRRWFKVDLAAEAAAFAAAHHSAVEPVERMTLRVENPNLHELPLGRIPGRRETGVVVSRILRAGAEEAQAANDETIVRVGDHLLAVGSRSNLQQFRRIVGAPSNVDLRKAPGAVAVRRLAVTRRAVLGKTLAELALDPLFGVTVTRMRRSGVEFTAGPDVRLQFGDTLMVVGEPAHLDQAAEVLGNSVRDLNETQIVTFFLGIAAGVLLGVAPVAIPGLPAPVRMGLAGGPLVMAIVLGRIGHVRGLVWRIPPNASAALRELGITLFLACVGLKAGARFFATIFSLQGLGWIAAGGAITLLPILVVAWFARRFMQMNYLTLCGLLAGSMTDPPALAFASGMNPSEAPSLAYATVYPLTMLLRILAAQILVLTLGG